MDSPDVAPSVKRSLADLIGKLNPFQLRKALEEKLKKIFLVLQKNHAESAILR